MKAETLEKLETLESRLRKLRAEIKKLTVKQVGRKSLRDEADALADFWVEEVRSPLEFRFGLESGTIEKYADSFKRLHVLSRPNNLVSSYKSTLDGLLKNFKNDLILPVQQSAGVSEREQLRAIISNVPEEDVSEYLAEAAACAEAGYLRAAIVMGWCAAIDRIHKALLVTGLSRFNAASATMKKQTSGRFKKFNKQFNVASLNDLQEVFDGDLLWVLEGMNLIDSNEGNRLRSLAEYRNQSAHPGNAPIGEVHVVAFFSDIVEIVLTGSSFSLS
jgi:hypothetical protein